jgi:hypothetical protein
MDPKKSFGVYPRFDTEYKKKSSLNFDMFKSEIFLNRKISLKVNYCRWFALFLIGVFMGAIAFGMS